MTAPTVLILIVTLALAGVIAYQQYLFDRERQRHAGQVRDLNDRIMAADWPRCITNRRAVQQPARPEKEREPDHWNDVGR